MIPFTPLNICHKTDTTQKRCEVFGYQVNIFVEDVDPLMELRPYAKISFDEMNSKMMILAGDRIGIRFGAIESPYEAVRMQADIHSNDLPKPFKTRYQDPHSKVPGVRLPCNDVMIADTIKCYDTDVYCSHPDDIFKFSLQGAG